MMWFLLLALKISTPADMARIAGFMDGRELAHRCEAEIGDPDTLVCNAYIIGSVDQLMAEQSVWGRGHAKICLPDKISVEDLRQVVSDHMRRDPPGPGVAASGLVVGAVLAAYPCPGNEAS